MSAGLIGGILGLACGLLVGTGVFALYKTHIDQSPQFKILWDDGLLYSLYMKFLFVIALLGPAFVGWHLGAALFGEK
jgi:hypothetical protein